MFRVERSQEHLLESEQEQNDLGWMVDNRLPAQMLSFRGSPRVVCPEATLARASDTT